MIFKKKKINIYKFAYNTGKGYWSESASYYTSEAHFLSIHNFDQVETKRLDYTCLTVDRNGLTPQQPPRPSYRAFDLEDY